MIKLPVSVTILSHEYAVVVLPRDDKLLEGAHGRVDFEGQQIVLAEDLKGNFARETLLHEVLHIIDYYTAGANDQVKERDIQRLSAVLYDTMQNNPLLLKRIFTLRSS